MCLWKNAIIWVITYPLGQIPPFLNALPYSVFLHTVHRDHLHANDLYSYFCNSIDLWEAVLQSAAPLSFRNPPIQILYIGVSLLTPLKNYFYLAVSDLCCSMWNLQLQHANFSFSNWSIIDIQYSISFRCMTQWFNA